MGLCMSCGGASETTRAGSPTASRDTALVLMPSGEMREYPRPATAARVLEDASASDGGEDWFLCDADKVQFEGAVPAVRDSEALRAGQIYFVLPASARRHGLRSEEVAALAVKASTALSSRAAASASAAPGRRRRGAVAPLVFAPPSEEDQQREEAFAASKAAAAAPPARRPAPRVRSDRRLERFASDLTAIPECDSTSE